MSEYDAKLTFWDHLDELRGVLFRVLAVSLVAGVIAFFFKEAIFTFVLAPGSEDFLTYQILHKIATYFRLQEPASFHVELINTGLAQQFMIHIKTALCIGVVVVSPYILYQLFSFIAPALYKAEKRLAVRILWSGYFMFIMGIALNYFLIFPLTFRFLGTYQVSSSVVNMISLDSYMATLITLSLSLGVMFELPVVAWLLAKTGFLTSGILTTYRRHAIVVILFIAAIITPTSDIFTLLIVSLPIYLLYELSILIVRRTSPNS